MGPWSHSPYHGNAGPWHAPPPPKDRGIRDQWRLSAPSDPMKWVRKQDMESYCLTGSCPSSYNWSTFQYNITAVPTATARYNWSWPTRLLYHHNSLLPCSTHTAQECAQLHALSVLQGSARPPAVRVLHGSIWPAAPEDYSLLAPQYYDSGFFICTVLANFPLTGGPSEASNWGLYTTRHRVEAMASLKKKQASQEDDLPWEEPLQGLDRGPGEAWVCPLRQTPGCPWPL